VTTTDSRLSSTDHRVGGVQGPGAQQASHAGSRQTTDLSEPPCSRCGDPNVLIAGRLLPLTVRTLGSCVGIHRVTHRAVLTQYAAGQVVIYGHRTMPTELTKNFAPFFRSLPFCHGHQGETRPPRRAFVVYDEVSRSRGCVDERCGAGVRTRVPCSRRVPSAAPIGAVFAETQVRVGVPRVGELLLIARVTLRTRRRGWSNRLYARGTIVAPSPELDKEVVLARARVELYYTEERARADARS
jgi:hypothetical protein